MAMSTGEFLSEAKLGAARKFISSLGVKPGKKFSHLTAAARRESTRITKTGSYDWASHGGVSGGAIGRHSNYKKTNTVQLFLGKRTSKYESGAGYVMDFARRSLGKSVINVSDFAAELRAYAEDGANQMINVIHGERKRPASTGGGKLENSIGVDVANKMSTGFLIKVGFQVKTSYEGLLIKSGRLRGNYAADKNDTTKYFAYGIGKKKDLPKYWAAVNYGSSHLLSLNSPIPTGHFFPGTRKPVSGESGNAWRFSQAKGYSFSFVPKTPIPAMNYIGKTYTYMKSGGLFSSFRRKVLSKIRKKI